MCLAQVAVRGCLVVVDPEAAALNLKCSLEFLLAVVGCPGEEVALLVCLALDFDSSSQDRPDSELALWRLSL